MEAILLRRLTEKSLVGFGKYAALTVQQVIDLQHTRYLRWVYFNSSNIDFIDSILDRISITPDCKINKPGTNKELCEFIDNIMNKKMTKKSKTKNIISGKMTQILKGKSMAYTETKGYLQAKNHGR